MPRETDMAAAAVVAVLFLTTYVDAQPLAACQHADCDGPTSDLVLLQLDASRLVKTTTESLFHRAKKNITLLEQVIDAALGADQDKDTAFSRAITRLGLAVFIGGIAVALIAAHRLGTGKENMRQVVTHAGIWQVIVIATAVLIYVGSAFVTIPGYLVVFAFGTFYNTYMHC
mmetsp:Transcript_31640/g.61157  ORF Transcript_31640/g.61157 Transcript_31640/m.61157 type:complete len:172 (+) Transcript_31640:43-558(+)|eukprot:CAMPEP_0172735852 /NCGR_PEP_ID=MMETSP1074-20121228/113490_1 /TAXON_ID=2916 /ORGANISM="Ceratium fusus, Strain PA161109" /LENGTH=171 /DNA_ID=CAMNT_0013564931 /DNA_START=37 /DNA_END=552 /DNA_ORIENTATION=-